MKDRQWPVHLLRGLRLKIPPPLIWLCCSALAYGLAQTCEWWSFRIPGTGWLVLLWALIGLGIILAAVLQCFNVKTTIHPSHPARTRTLITDGIFAFSRNPMYLGLLCLLFAWVVYLGELSALLVLPVFVISLNLLQIIPEEQILAQKFGEAYQLYQQQVSRWC